MMEKRLVIIGIPTDLGANVRGANYGPKAIRKELIPLLRKKKIPFHDRGDIPIPPRPKKTDPHKQNFRQIRQVDKNLLRQKIDLTKEFPLFLGGDHSAEDGITQLLTKSHKLGLIWFDAHADFNNIITSQESPWGGGHIHGMVLAEILGHALIRYGHRTPHIREKNTTLIGLRDLRHEGIRWPICTNEAWSLLLAWLGCEGAARLMAIM